MTKHANWDTLTVGQFLDLYRLSINTELDEMGKLERAVAIIYSKSEREVEEMTMGEFTTLSTHAAQFLTKNIPGKAVRVIKANGRKYRITYDPTKLRQRQYVEIIHFGDKPIENMHLIMASVVRPVRWGITRKNEAKEHQAIATDMLQAPVKDVYHACVFFCKLFAALMQATQDFLVAEMTTKGISPAKARKIITASLNAMDGFIVPPELQNTKE